MGLRFLSTTNINIDFGGNRHKGESDKSREGRRRVIKGRLNGGVSTTEARWPSSPFSLVRNHCHSVLEPLSPSCFSAPLKPSNSTPSLEMVALGKAQGHSSFPGDRSPTALQTPPFPKTQGSWPFSGLVSGSRGEWASRRNLRTLSASVGWRERRVLKALEEESIRDMFYCEWSAV